MPSGPVIPSSTAPSPKQVVATFSDTEDEDQYPCRGIIVNEAGTIDYEDASGENVQFSFPVGVFPISLKRINSTNTAVSSGAVLLLY